jgi:hypothetical protein
VALPPAKIPDVQAFVDHVVQSERQHPQSDAVPRSPEEGSSKAYPVQYEEARAEAVISEQAGPMLDSGYRRQNSPVQQTNTCEEGDLLLGLAGREQSSESQSMFPSEECFLDLH